MITPTVVFLTFRNGVKVIYTFFQDAINFNLLKDALVASVTKGMRHESEIHECMKDPFSAFLITPWEGE